MNPDQKSLYTIHRLRLIKFHNIENATIELNGHLFLLGDNGSGKTTILDAIHYVLTGGEMEYNAAAHVAGARRSGRTTQGIVMRYNAETGPLAKSGGVTYAALEMRNPQGKVITAVIGMTTRSMDERIQQWGLIESKPLEEIPLLLAEGAGQRPATRLELKKQLGANKVLQIGAYRKELAARLFGGDETFKDVVRLLHMGKSYREIVSRSADYHELFVKLLPEPRTQVFETLILGLRDLEGAKAALDGMRQKSAYLEELDGLRSQIAAEREAGARYAWLMCHVALEELAAERETVRQNLRDAVVQREQQETLQQTKQRERERLMLRLDDLKAKDRDGLVRQEKELATRVNHLGAKRQNQAATVAEQKRQAEAARDDLQRAHEAMRKRAAVAKRETAAVQVPLDVAPALLTFDELARAERDTQPDAPDFAALHQAAAAARDEQRRREFAVGTECDALHDEMQRAETELERLTAQVEFDLPAVVQAQKLLADHMITARPLYALLVWKTTVRKSMAAEIEAFIGERVLSTLVVDSADFEAARLLLFNAGMDLPISHEDLGHEPVPRWILDVFDPTEPLPLRLLAGEMAAPAEPTIERIKGLTIAQFRAHHRRLDTTPAALIGSEARRQSLEDACRTCRARIRSLKADHKQRARDLAEIERDISRLDQFTALLQNAQTELGARLQTLSLARLACEHRRDALAQAQVALAETVAEQESEQVRLTTMQAMIRDQGLAELEQQIERLTKKLERAGDQLNAVAQEIGACQARETQMAEKLDQLAYRRDRQQALLAERADALQLLCPQVDDLAYYVLRTKGGAQFRSRESIENAAQVAAGNANQRVGTLVTRLKDPVMASSFAFYYEQAANKLTDRRGRNLAEALAAQQQTIHEQEQVVNDKTISLFKEIIHNELVRVLREQVYQLEEMMKRINRILGERTFGRTRYRFNCKVVDGCRELVETIRRLSAFDEQAQQRLQEFFEDHQDAIVNTEPGAVPDLLDYRNWYRFEMKVSTQRDQEPGAELTMDRSVKAVGSGGEQAVPNYLLVLTIAYFLYRGSHQKRMRLMPLLFDEAFYGIDAQRRDQLLAFADDLGLQLMVASPDQDGVKQEIAHSKTLLILKDQDYDVHILEFAWENQALRQMSLLDDNEPAPVAFTPIKAPS